MKKTNSKFFYSNSWTKFLDKIPPKHDFEKKLDIKLKNFTKFMEGK